MGSAHINTELDQADSYPRQLATLDPTWPGEAASDQNLVKEPTTFYISQRRSLISVYDGQFLTICFWSQKVANEKQ